MADAIIILILLALAALALRSCMRRKKTGGCTGGCSQCTGSCATRPTRKKR